MYDDIIINTNKTVNSCNLSQKLNLSYMQAKHNNST